MKKKLVLQLFAEAGEGAEPTGGNEPKGQEGKEGAEPTGGNEKKYSDDDLDKIIGKKFAEWQKKQDKAVKEAEKLASMNATQRAEHERDELKKQLDDYKKKDSLASMTKEARKMLSEEGLSVNDELLSVIVTTDAEETKAAVEGFAKLFKDAVESAVKERLKGEPPKRGTSTGNGGATTMTKEQIMAIKDPELRQKKMLEHKELFNF